MAWIIATKSKRRVSAGLAAGVIIVATIALGTFSGSASAERRRDEHRGGYHHDWSGGYYRSPPVAYARPYYYPPPVVYGPGIGLNFNIR